MCTLWDLDIAVRDKREPALTPQKSINNTHDNHLVKKLEPKPQLVRNFKSYPHRQTRVILHTRKCQKSWGWNQAPNIFCQPPGKLMNTMYNLRKMDSILSFCHFSILSSFSRDWIEGHAPSSMNQFLYWMGTSCLIGMLELNSSSLGWLNYPPAKAFITVSNRLSSATCVSF